MVRDLLRGCGNLGVADHLESYLVEVFSVSPNGMVMEKSDILEKAADEKLIIS